MAKIIYGHSSDDYQNLKIAGDFSGWEPLPMGRNSITHLWEHKVDFSKLPNGTEKVHFKFIDDNGNWFTDEDYPKEVDASSNENNVKLFTKEEIGEEDPAFEMDDEGPESPAPSLKTGSENPSGATKPADIRDRDESVGGSAVLVNHSDAEDDEEDVQDVRNSENDETALTSRDHNPDQYKDVLARIIAFFTNLFRSWFG